MKSIFILICILLFALYSANGQQKDSDSTSKKIVSLETNGIVSVEGEYFYKQSHTQKRSWYRISQLENATYEDISYYKKASNQGYIKILPDTRVTHSDEVIRGENFTDKPGQLGIVHYKVKFNTPGRYYVWVRALSTGSEDNGVHVGINGQWPNSGKRMQWCVGKKSWTWESKQRTKEVHCGVPQQIYLDIDSVGIHDIQFSMREDGFRMDKFLLTKDSLYVPTAKGPVAETVSYFATIANKLADNKVLRAQAFPTQDTQFYKHGKNWLAINVKKHKEAITSTNFNFESGKYDVVFVGVGENDGSSEYTVLINDKKIGSFIPPHTNNMFEESKKNSIVWENLRIKKNDKITIKAKAGTNGDEWTRARWAGIIFTPKGKGQSILDAPSSFEAN